VLELLLDEKNIENIEACTLVMLSTGQFWDIYLTITFAFSSVFTWKLIGKAKSMHYSF
jgi:hypothetical protein